MYTGIMHIGSCVSVVEALWTESVCYHYNIVTTGGCNLFIR